MTAHFKIVGTDLPGTSCNLEYTNIHVGVQRKQEVVDQTPGDAKNAVFEFDVDVRNGRFTGPYIHGRGDERFIYLSWGQVDNGAFAMFRRAKLHVSHLDANEVDGKIVTGTLGLTDGKGNPVCASVRPPGIAWDVTM